MLLTSGMDSGPVFIQKTFDITENQSKVDVGLEALKLGASMLVDNLPLILDGSLQAKDQNEKMATFTSRLSKQQSKIDISTMNSIEAYNKMRSLEFFPKAKLSFSGIEFVATKFHISDKPKSLSYVCRDGKFISIDALMAPSGKVMSSSDFLRGYSN
jgi:methionyl-tRNA formyltransferase